ncbi:hypothetical protein pb186bvf_017082 [Paramecium bursaria]
MEKQNNGNKISIKIYLMFQFQCANKKLMSPTTLYLNPKSGQETSTVFPFGEKFSSLQKKLYPLIGLRYS